MKIAYLSLQAVQEGQDSWAAVMEIIEGWRVDGWDVDLWAPDYRDIQAPGRIRRLLRMRATQRQLMKDMRAYDAIYIRGHMMAYTTARRARKLEIPIFQECNGTYEDLFVAWPETRIARPLFEYAQRWQYRHADTIFCGTKKQAEWLAREAPRIPLVVSPNGANDKLFTPDAQTDIPLPERFALFFGQFAPWQGIEVLLDAFENDSWPKDLPLVFVGDGLARDAVLAAQKRHHEDIVYLGPLAYERLPGVIARAQVSFSPQYTHERGEAGFSALKLYETMSCGVAVIGSDYPGVGDIITRYGCGIVVPPGNAEAIAKAVAALNADPQRATMLGNNGRRAVEEECSWYQRSRQRKGVIEEVTR